MESKVSIRLIRLCSIAIMCIAAVISYSHQAHLLKVWGVDALAAGALPITVDLLAIICTLSIHTEGVARPGRRAAIVVLLAAGTVSSAANFIAGGTLGSKVANVWAVAAYLLAEWVAAKVKTAPPAVDPKRSEAARQAAVTRRANKARTSKPRVRTPKAPKDVAEAAAMLAKAGTAPTSPAV
jgi:hypothetical protein